MEIETPQHPQTLSQVMSAAAIQRPQKRKAVSSEDGAAGASTAEQQSDANGALDPQLHKDQMDAGKVVCEQCGEGVFFKDKVTGAFTVENWEKHKRACSKGSQVSENVPQSPEAHLDSAQPPAKRRRAKRSEDERIEYLRSDPYVAQFEAYRVLCASCDKWIRLRPNSTYCSIPWDAHRKSCLSKRLSKAAAPVDDRSAIFSSDPNVKKFDAERVLCRVCDTWIQLGTGDNLSAVQMWMTHRASCASGSASPPATTASTSATHIPSIDSVPPPPKHLLALVASSAPPPAGGLSSASTLSASVKGVPPTPHAATFKDLNPTNFPAQENRRRNAEQRAAALHADPLISEVEPNRVFCSLCRKWVQLRQDSSYCAYPWLQHRGKCLTRHQRKVDKNSELTGQKTFFAGAVNPAQLLALEDSDDPESEEGVESGTEEERARRRAERREARRRAKLDAQAQLLATQSLFDTASLGDDDADGDYDVDPDVTRSPRYADLDTLSGRLDFLFGSVRYLFKSTYASTDDLTIASLVGYLNAAMPPDKHEDFDTAEVTKGALVLHERGEFAFEGDAIRIPA